MNDIGPIEHFMLDIETIGSVPPHGDCDIPAPVQIVLVGFPIEPDRTDGAVDIYPVKNLFIDPEQITSDEFPFDWGWRAVAFHSKESDVIELAVESGMSPLRATKMISEFWERNASSDAKMWAMGIDFDVPVLRTLFRATGRDQMWNYRNVRDMRALDLPYVDGSDIPGEGHNAYHDAKVQIRKIQQSDYGG